jgi:hypothetical protein
MRPEPNTSPVTALLHHSEIAFQLRTVEVQERSGNGASVVSSY